MEGLTREMKNVDLFGVIKEQLETGEVVVIDKVPTKNENYINVYVAQQVDDLFSNSNNVSKFEAIALEWNNTIIRARFNATTTFGDSVEKGQVLSDLKIRVTDSLEPEFDEHRPRQDSDGNPRCVKGAPIFRTTQIVTIEEFKTLGGHDVMDYDDSTPEEKTEKISAPAAEIRP